MIKVIDNFFTEENFNHFCELTKSGWTTLDNSLHKDLTEPFYTEECVKYIGERFDIKFQIYRSAMHGLSLNTNSAMHRDVNSTHTALLFLNPNWQPTWNGGTFFGKDCNDYVQFRPNRMILFLTEGLDHIGSSFSSEALDFRYQAIWHLNQQK